MIKQMNRFPNIIQYHVIRFQHCCRQGDTISKAVATTQRSIRYHTHYKNGMINKPFNNKYIYGRYHILYVIILIICLYKYENSNKSNFW